MTILGIITFIVFVVWVVYDYKKINNELRRCPKCNQMIKQKFNWKFNDKPISIQDKGKKLNVANHKCENCGFCWSHNYEYNDNH